MKIIFHPCRQRASTMTDVLIVLVTLVLLGTVALPMLARPRHCGGQRINCVSNLKQVGLALRIWSYDHNDQFPWLVSTNEGGTLEQAGSGNVFLHFQVASNELSTAKILSCRSDASKAATNDFNELDNRNLSYFVGLTANETDFQSILSGDRNLTTNGTALAAGMYTLATANQLGWTKAIHNTAGNIGLSDGSVQQVSVAALQKQWQASTNTARRLAIP